MKNYKEKIVHELLSKVKSELANLEKSHAQAHADACGDEMKSDGKYDTRAIEAGYLVGAQKKRIEDLKLELKMLEAIEIRSFTPEEEVAIGALVEIKLNAAKKKYFISPTAGGTLLNINSEPILVISVFSPIGSEVLGLHKGDEFQLTDDRLYTVIDVF